MGKRDPYSAGQREDGSPSLMLEMGTPDSPGSRLMVAICGLLHELHPNEPTGPYPTLIVLPSMHFDAIRDRLAADAKDYWFVARPRRRRPDLTKRWFMILGVRIVAADYFAEAFTEEPRCPLRTPAKDAPSTARSA